VCEKKKSFEKEIPDKDIHMAFRHDDMFNIKINKEYE